ncbi:lipopolysaccharide heptosyltransferase II [Thiosulfativibrio zosterae]|uniref:lipopolysaccharide heptosyltransferase II n=1 Tax=Thiosulfativibrio zosterae TaxID=2675053 RepID=A0A6F8PPR5_9GAMM|nr:lipopolysaccharide heptosyltransferase II [Thiosulfativibrio zosterae]BBP44028.1 ADP-heptose--LPS heptosyltransferase [Thiosulfativibrio zosterae]
MMTPNKVHKIAVLGLKRIGDAIYTLPIFEALKQRYPEAIIEVFSEPQVKDIYLANPFIDQLHVYSKKVFWRFCLADLKGADFDACIVLHNAFKYALLPFIAEVPVRIGYEKELRSFLLTHHLPLSKTVVHRLEHNARLADFLGVNSRLILPQLYFSQDELGTTDDLLLKHQLSEKAYVAFIVGSISPTRRWFPNNFAQVALNITLKLGLKVVILGGPDDIDLANQVKGLCSENDAVINLAGQTTLRETLFLFKASKAVVTNDTGPMHAASAIGVPVVTWFGAANEAEIAPPSPLTTVLNAKVFCSPCVKERCPYQLECLSDITPEMVFKTLREKLE